MRCYLISAAKTNEQEEPIYPHTISHCSEKNIFIDVPGGSHLLCMYIQAASCETKATTAFFLTPLY